MIADLIPDRGPGRIVVGTLLVNSIGTGAYLAAGVLFFTRAVGFDATTVGAMLGVGGVAALAASSPLGYLSDRCGPRRLAIILCVVESIAMAGLIFVRSPWQLAVVSAIVLTGEQSSRTVRNVIVGRIGGARQTRLRAQARAVANLGMAVGGGLAALALLADSSPAYLAVLVANSVTFLVAAAMLTRLPHYPPVTLPRGGRRLPVLRDWRFGVVVGLYAVMSLQVAVLSVVVPLWITTATNAPPWLAAASVVINTVVVVRFQVRASAPVVDPVSAGRSMRRAGVAFLASALLFAVSAQDTAWAAAALIIVAIVIYTVGELWQAAAGFELAHSLAPAHAAGQYQGLFDLGAAASRAVAPAVLIALCIDGGWGGWLAYGALLLVAGLLTPHAIRLTSRADGDGPSLPRSPVRADSTSSA
ncbi:MFS transporter [Kibdelosporangium aridum]|uniref:Major Facilitator Superfamily protein n=1 Tax=Kibdelosporangium aridum TaxID=2030 RepID=A0A1Y5X475_KIBAR|nr:MFS transporter [Kibdelosporangium aridum]SMC67259.1 Major Facilitator Superfamily protein [Kibdelosporangium aridum]